MAKVLLVHGAWMNAASWAPWVARYEALGHSVAAPSWPSADGDPATLRSSPPAAGSLGFSALVDYYAEHAVGDVYLIGHSFGGMIVQALMSRGVGRAGVALHPAPPKGVLPTLDAARAGFGVFSTWGFATKMLALSRADFAWGWVHDLRGDEQDRLYDSYVVPTPGGVYNDALKAPFTDTLAVKPEIGPLLIVAGGKDRTVSASMNAHNARLCPKAEFRTHPDRTHATCIAPGWEAVADEALEFVLRY